MSKLVSTAIILCGGYGTRIADVEPDLPKSLIKVSDGAIIDYIIDCLTESGIENIILALGFRAEQIIEYIKINHSETKIEFVIEKEKLGTGGAVRKVLSMFDEDTYLVLNGDTFVRYDISEFWLSHIKSKSTFSILSVFSEDLARYGSVEFDSIDKRKIIDFFEKKALGRGWINAGHYLIHRKEFLDKTPKGEFSIENFMKILAHQGTLYGHRSPASLIDIGVPRDLEYARDQIVWPERPTE